jgi:hypothetical protein
VEYRGRLWKAALWKKAFEGRVRMAKAYDLGFTVCCTTHDSYQATPLGAAAAQQTL